jgi:hypothetical protein
VTLRYLHSLDEQGPTLQTTYRNELGLDIDFRRARGTVVIGHPDRRDGIVANKARLFACWWVAVVMRGPGRWVGFKAVPGDLGSGDLGSGDLVPQGSAVDFDRLAAVARARRGRSALLDSMPSLIGRRSPSGRRDDSGGVAGGVFGAHGGGQVFDACCGFFGQQGADELG